MKVSFVFAMTVIHVNVDYLRTRICDVFAGMTVLNKSKWKGGTLQIEAAKESFLTRYNNLVSLKFSCYERKFSIRGNVAFQLFDNESGFCSFRLAEERKATTMQSLQQPAPEDKRQKKLDSLSSVGVDNFTMKAAVPGSEVPGHKV